MPYLGSVGDLVALELHDIDVVGAGVASVRRYRNPGACMRSMEHAVRGNVVSLRIRSE